MIVSSLTADDETEEEETALDERKTTEEVEVKRPQGISLFMFILIALTGAVLFVLNITGVLCYLRRRSFFQSLSGIFFFMVCVGGIGQVGLLVMNHASGIHQAI